MAWIGVSIGAINSFNTIICPPYHLQSRVRIKRGESLRLCFGAAVHQGSLEKAAELYQAFLLGNEPAAD
jgi:hypothetical protein